MHRVRRTARWVLVAVSFALQGAVVAAPPVPDAAQTDAPWTVDRLVSRWIEASDDTTRRAALVDIKRAGPLGAQAVMRLLPRAQVAPYEAQQDLHQTAAALAAHLAPLVIESFATEELHHRRPDLVLAHLPPEQFATVLDAARAGTPDAFRRTALALRTMRRAPDANPKSIALEQAFALECLDSDDPQVRRVALGRLSAEAFERLWFDLALDADPEIRLHALTSLTTLQAVRAIGPVGVDLRLPVVLTQVRDSDPRIRSVALGLARRLGRNANLHEAAWKAYASAADDRVRYLALQACMSSRSTRSQLVRLLSTVRPDESESALIAEYLQFISIDNELLELALPHVAHARVSAVRPDWKYDIATDLGHAAAPVLEQAVRDADAPTAQWAAAALALVAIDFGATYDNAGAALARRIPEWVRVEEPTLLEYPKRPFLALAFIAPERIVPLAEWAVGRAEDGDDPNARTLAGAAMLAVVGLERVPAEGVHLLQEQLDGGPLQDEAVRVVGQARVDRKPFVEALLSLAEQTEQPLIRQGALESLASLAPEDEAALDRLLDLVRQLPPDDRTAVFHAVFGVVNRRHALQDHLLRRWAERPELVAAFVEHMAAREFGVISISPALYSAAFPTLLDRAAGLVARPQDPVWAALGRAAIYDQRLVELLELQIRMAPAAASSAINTLQALRPVTVEAMEVVIRSLNIDAAQIWAIRALPKFGAMATDALPALQRIAHSDDPRAASAARRALEEIRAALDEPNDG